MGLDSIFYPPQGVKRSDVEEFLILLGYNKYQTPKYLRELKATCFSYVSKQPYESLQGVGFNVYISDGSLVATGRNNIHRNKADNDFHNNTLKLLRKRFGGYFESDYGKNRYFPFHDIDRRKDELGCYIVTSRALDRLKDMSILMMASGNWQTPVQKDDLVWMNRFHPEVILGNLAIIHMISTLEGFFKDLYVALLTFSNKKGEILKGTTIRSSDLLKVSDGIISIEEAYANGLNFQGVGAVSENFGKLDQSLGVRQLLSKKYRNRKETFADFFSRLAEQRHRYVHHGESDWLYSFSSVQSDLRFCDALINKVYKTVAEKKNWPYEAPY